MSDALELRAVERTFEQAGEKLPILRGASATLRAGELVALVGPSGAGKSTLLHIAGLLERPDGGDVILDGRPCGKMADGERTEVRRSKLGFVYQFHHLLPEFSALENIVVPQMIAGVPRRKAEARGRELLGMVGLAHRETHRPARLSGGEQQRVAIARAMANRPAVLLADEPTGNLDEETADAVFDTLLATVRETRVAVLVATHNLELAARCDAVYRLHNGRVEPL